MRRLVLWFVLAFAAAPAYAEQPAPASAEQIAPAAEQPAPAYAEQPAPAALTENKDAKQSDWKGPSGFWTNPHPAQGGAYRWRMMAVGGVFLIATGYLMWRLVKKANSERATRR